MVLEMIMESVFAVVDVFFVARLGANAVATVGLTESLLTLDLHSRGGIEHRRFRHGRAPDRRAGLSRAAQAAAQTLLLGVSISVVLGVVGSIFAPELLGLMGASPEVVAYGSGYTRVFRR